MTLDDIKASRPRVARAKIEATTEADIARHAAEDGEDPQRSAVGYSEDPQPAAVRAQLGMTQAEFAEALTIPLPTLRNWEQGRVTLDPASRALLRIVAREPKAALRALTRSKAR